jgi:GntR family transcriptional regulator
MNVCIRLTARMGNASSPEPLYRQIAAELAARIERGAIKRGGLMPSEAAIVTEFSVARGTARRAIQHLRETGIIVTKPQRGSYATAPPRMPRRTSSTRYAMNPESGSN